MPNNERHREIKSPLPRSVEKQIPTNPRPDVKKKRRSHGQNYCEALNHAARQVQYDLEAPQPYDSYTFSSVPRRSFQGSRPKGTINGGGTEQPSVKHSGYNVETKGPLNQVADSLSMGFVAWQILPQGHWPRHLQEFLNALKSTAVHRGQRYDDSRIEVLKSLHPSKCYTGAFGAINGYIAFVFPKSGLVALDSPVFGNAVYLLTVTLWEELSKCSKHDLLTNHSVDVVRIIHRGDWVSRLKRRLGARP